MVIKSNMYLYFTDSVSSLDTGGRGGSLRRRRRVRRPGRGFYNNMSDADNNTDNTNNGYPETTSRYRGNRGFGGRGRGGRGDGRFRGSGNRGDGDGHRPMNNGGKGHPDTRAAGEANKSSSKAESSANTGGGDGNGANNSQPKQQRENNGKRGAQTRERNNTTAKSNSEPKTQARDTLVNGK